MSNISRVVIDNLLPPGSAWNVEKEGDFDLLLNGIADNNQDVISFLALLSSIRDPNKTILLNELEKEYGIFTDFSLTEQERRDRLAAFIFITETNGSEDALETILQNLGFDVLVHANNPAIDPDLFFNAAFQMVLGGDNAYIGRPDAFLGKTGYDLLVNGNIFIQTPAYLMQAGGDTSFLGNGNAVLGRFDTINEELVVYPISDDPADWPFFFFVGGPATRDPGTGEILSIEPAEVPASREEEFKRIILKYKPVHSWAGLIVDYV